MVHLTRLRCLTRPSAWLLRMRSMRVQLPGRSRNREAQIPLIREKNRKNCIGIMK